MPIFWAIKIDGRIELDSFPSDSDYSAHGAVLVGPFFKTRREAVRHSGGNTGVVKVRVEEVKS